MNMKQNNKLVSFSACEAVLKANPEIVSVPGLPGKVAMLSARIGEIHELAQIQNQPLEVTTARRDRIFEELADAALAVAAAATSLAQDRGDGELLRAARVAPSEFSVPRRSRRVWLAQRVHDAAQGVLEHLAPYGVTEETLASLRVRIEAATAGIHLPRTAVTSRRAATQRLVALFREVDGLFKDGIDRLVLRLRKSQPQFYADYRAARQLVDWRGKRPAAEDPSSTPPQETPAAVTAPVSQAA